ncbi:MAG: sporulation protein YabP [Clostridia bacterium]|nr:sporulation protein YabP [Clostridia bacterium]
MENVTNIINDKKFTTSKIVLDNRKRATINGVEKALSSNEGCVILKVSGTNLVVMGRGLHIEKLDVESGVVEIEGEFDSFKFAASAKPGNVFKRIFK